MAGEGPSLEEKVRERSQRGDLRGESSVGATLASRDSSYPGRAGRVLMELGEWSHEEPAQRGDASTTRPIELAFPLGEEREGPGAQRSHAQPVVAPSDLNRSNSVDEPGRER